VTALFSLILWLLLGLSHAQETPTAIVVPLDGAPGTSSRDLEVVARGIAQSLGESNEIVVVSGAGLVGRLTTLKQQALQQARDATSEGTLLLSEGDPDIGIAFLEEAVAAHDRAGSAVVRREEMADASFALAKAWLQTGREEQAAEVLELALRLVPDYLDVNPDQVDPALRALARRVEGRLMERPPRRLSAAGAQALAADLGGDRLVHGFVLNDGSLTLVVYDAQGQELAVARAAGPFSAPRLGDPRYAELARPLADAILGRETEPAPPPPPARRRRGGLIAAISVGILGGGAATAAILAARAARDPDQAWALQIRIIE